MVPNDPEDEDKESSPSPKVAKPAKKYLRRVSSIGKNNKTKICSIAFFVKQLVAKGISKRASEFFTNFRKTGTPSAYKSTLKNWVSWCHQQEADHFRCPTDFVLDLLADLFQSRYSYWSIGSHRWAISAFHTNDFSSTMGKHPLVKSLMKRVGHLHPPTAKCSFIWDVEQAVKYLRSCQPLQVLDTRILSMLIALRAAEKNNETQTLYIQHMVKTENEFTFAIVGTTKTSKQGKKVPDITFHILLEKESLCPYKTLEHCLEVTHSWQIKGNRNKPLLNHIELHKPISTPTIARWVKSILKFIKKYIK